MELNKYVHKSLVKDKINSHLLNEERSIRIYLPPGYNELLSYPIFYAQDGQDIFMYGRIATITNYLILEKGMEPVIIVGVDVDKSKRTEEYSTIGSRNKAYKEFFVKELIPYIEEKYSVRNTELNRFLIGDSLGATVSLDLCIEYPNLFTHFISLSGAFLQPTKDKLQQVSDLSWLTMWMLIGTEETNIETHFGKFNFLEWNQEIKKMLVDKNCKLHYLEEEGSHIWGFWQKFLPEALLHFLRSDEI